MFLGSIITQVGTVVTAAIGWMGDYLEVITDEPLLMLFVCLPVVGFGIGLVRRMIRL